MSERDWTLRVTPTEAGVQVEFGLSELGGEPVTAVIALDRGEARRFARALLAAAGDAAERTFPHPKPTGQG
ncbi:conserved hypothetical protein [Methylobacterium sp. 4-46]|uniref:hypothetical protein n=1 Tax=unclassified Methylobacterium TaxID=2615210 RepID=UPI000165CC0A|nr:MULTISPECIES: hypothetical protein [Methylobacterium]ACA18711.1 conserved hypothetical protein [Methylobacterium sp. 4-46]WFT77943.1 hypothetical protein QA634_21905 [Methylobacterium nodulans]